MRAFLRLIVVVTGMALLVFAVRDMVSFGMGVSSSVSHAPREVWDALGDTLTWGIQYKQWATIAFIVCLVALYLYRVPSIKSK